MARRRPFLPPRTAAEWGAHGALALLAMVLGYYSVTHSVAHVIATADPAHAHLLAPDDGQVTAVLAVKKFVAHPDPDPKSASARLARLALRQDPTAVKAVATLGLQAQLRGNTTQARRLFAYAQTLSRRDLQTQLWAIEDAVQRKDIIGALHHYDVALRTSGDAPNLLFPILTSALAQLEIRQSLVRVFKMHPRWEPAFLDYIESNGGDPRVVAQFFLDMHRAGIMLSPEAVAAAINGLIGVGDFDDAWRFYSTAHPGADRRMSRDPRFRANLSTPSVFDWTPTNDASVSASLQVDAQGGIFDFAAPASVGGTLLQQMQILPPGIYQIDGHSREITQPDRSLPYWVLTCSNGQELGRVAVPNSTNADGAFAGRFTVPADCPVQTLALVARPSDEVAGVSGQIDQVRLFPLK